MSDSSRKVAGEIDRFDDVYHAYGDDRDGGDDADRDFLEYFNEWNKNDDEPEPPNAPETSEEQQLSQKVSQLLTTHDVTPRRNKRPSLTPTEPEATTKRMRVVSTAASAIGHMPAYLTSEEKNFDELVAPHLQQNANALTVDELRELAHLEHQMALSELHLSLWLTYLDSTTGQLFYDAKSHEWRVALSTRTGVVPNEVPKLCPDKLREIIRADTQTNAKDSADYVRIQVRKFKQQHLSCQQQLQENRGRLRPSLTPELEQAISTFVEQYGIGLHRLMIESQITVVKYDYYEDVLANDLRNEHPFIEQVRETVSFASITILSLTF